MTDAVATGPAGQSLGPDDLRTMARVAGLTIDDERVPAVLAEVNSQLAYGHVIDSVLIGVPESAFAPFDPQWVGGDRDEVSR